jgi:hypothetical protein
MALFIALFAFFIGLLKSYLALGLAPGLNLFSAGLISFGSSRN